MRFNSCSFRFLSRALAFVMAMSLACATIGGLAAESTAKRLLIVGQGPDGHPPTTHEFMAGANVLAELLKPYHAIQTSVVKADEPWSDGPALIDQADNIA